MKLLTLLGFCGFFLCSITSLRAPVPQLLHVQGRVTDNRSNLDGVGEFKFSLVRSNGEVTFWSNDGTGNAGREPNGSIPVAVDKGLFSVALGDTALPNMLPVPHTVFTNSGVHLRIWFRKSEQGEGQAFQLLSPDLRFSAVGYAMFAATVSDGSITAAKLASNAVGSVALAPGSVGTVHLRDGAVTAEKLAPGVVPPPELSDGSILTRHLAADAVTTAKLAAGAVTADKLSLAAVTASNLSASAVGTAQLANSAVTRDKLAVGAVGTQQLASGAVGSNQLAAGAAFANLLASGQSSVASSGMILSFEANSAALASAGYVQAGSLAVTPDRWQVRQGPLTFHPSIAVLTETELIACDLAGDLKGGRYDPTTDKWRPIARLAKGSSTQAGPLFVWTGTELIVWGGFAGLRDGYLYNPTTDSWRPMTTNGAPTGRINATAIWTGFEMIIWGGQENTTFLNTGSAYNPERDQWRPISISGSPTPRASHTAVWTGEEMIIWGGVAAISGGRYRLSTDTWTNLPTVGAPPPSASHSAVWTGSEMIVWGGNTFRDGRAVFGGRFVPASNSWRSVTSFNSPLDRIRHFAVWTGTEMVVWGGENIVLPESATATGGRYIPATDQWIPTAPAPLTSGFVSPPNAFWVGGGMLIPFPGSRSTGQAMLFWQPPVTAYLYRRP